MKASVVEDIDVAPPGSIEPRYVDGVLMGIAITCAGCGSPSWIPLDGTRGWSFKSDNPWHIEPSIFHTKEKGGCGWHGFLRDGEFTHC